jgi:PAS domain S-box-containing protein
MRIGLLILDGRGAIIGLNAAAEQILGYAAEEVQGRPGEEILDGLADVLADAASGAREAGPEGPLRANARRKDGRGVQLVVTPYSIPGNGRPATGDELVLVIQDAEQQDRMERQLQHLDRLRSLDEFAAGIVHEIRNPLAGISINAQHIAEEIDKQCRKRCMKAGRSGQFLEQMRDILADVQSIEGIVRRVLDFAHPDRPQVRETPVGDIVGEVLRFSKMPLRCQGIRVLTDLDAPVKVRVDVSQMKQVFFNIVRNACEAMPGGGELRVRAGALPAEGSRPIPAAGTPPSGNGQARVEVEDTGRGIPEEFLERVFDPFFSMHREGTGLGLSISRKIVESHGGRIEVQSTPGKGTRFGIVLPSA